MVQLSESSQTTGEGSHVPVELLQVSITHGLLLEQLFNVCWQTPLLQESIVQGLLSSQSIGAKSQFPFAELQESVVHGF